MRRSLIILVTFISCAVFAQDDDKDVKKSPLQGFSVSGNYRFYAQHRTFSDPYAIQVVEDEPIYLDGRSILIGDATQLPELSLNISGRPNSKTSFGTDLVIWNQNTGNFDYYRNLQLGINLYGNFTTKYANVGVKMGGIHWHTMTPFTMQSFSGYNRYSVFERNPWDPQYKEIAKRYDDYQSKGAITQDARWGSQPFQGVILDLSEMPLGLSSNLIYGKAQNAGSALTAIANDPNDSTSNSNTKFYENTIPNIVYGGRLIKTFKKHEVSLNTINHKTYKDFLALDSNVIRNHIYTTNFNLNFNKISVSGELGAGYYNQVYSGDSINNVVQALSKDTAKNVMASVKIRFDKKLTKIPFELHLYHLGPKVVNANAEFVNTTITETPSAASGTTAVIGANGVLQQNGSAMLGLGQMANNRQGLNLNTDIKIKDLSIILGSGFARELENINNKLTYGHAINGLTMSRFWRWSFPSNVGPYNRKSVLYRGVFESVNLTDLDDKGNVVNNKYFNNMEAQLKYKLSLFNRDWFLFYLGSYNSIQKTFSPITVFSEEAYIRAYTHQFESYYNIHPKLVLSQYLGWERIIGNYDTQVDIDSERPLNQEGLGIGLGIDYMMSKNTGLYLRHRWFKFEDRSYALDKFSGQETTLELKINF